MRERTRDDRGLTEVLVGDGRPLLIVTGVSLMFAGGFAIFLAASGQFLPHDIAFLQMSPEELCSLAACRVVDFMVHDRVAFGGALVAIGSLYVWLAAFPMARGEGWAWWTLVLTGTLGFGSFLSYLGYGYLDSWHGIGTLLLLPVFVGGLIRSRSLLSGDRSLRSVTTPGMSLRLRSTADVGRGLMLLAAGGMTLGGLTILWVGITDVFVPQDLSFMGTSKAALDAINPRLVPLLAHDRAGFGGAVATTGLCASIAVWCSRPSRSLWQVLAFSWAVASGAAIAIHAIVGYTDLFHLAPAVLGAATFAMGLALAAPAWLFDRARDEKRTVSE